MDRKVFECISCGHLTPFRITDRPRCAKCGGMTGIVDNDTESPRLGDSPSQAPSHLDANTSGRLH